jgi:hypothetical protein
VAFLHHFHRHPETGRAAELDPSTFDHPEDFQREPLRFDWGRIAGLGIFLASAVGVGFVIAWGVM